MIITGQFNDSLPPIMDGVAVAAHNYAFWLNKNHSPSFTVGPEVPGQASDERALRYRSLRSAIADPYRLGFPRVDRSFNKTIESIPFDLIHAHCPFVSGNYAFTLAQKRCVPLVTTFHSKYRDDFMSKMKVERLADQFISYIVRFYEKADSVWVPNTAIIDTLRSYGYKGPVEYVPNGSDILPPAPGEADKLHREGRELLKVHANDPVLLYVGQHRWIKNLKLLVQSLTHLHTQQTPFQMRFVGTGDDEKEIREEVEACGLGGAVQFLGPVYERAALRKIYAATDLFLFPSLYDNASLATREAASQSVPTLFVAGATTAHGIQDAQNGFVAENAPEAYAAKIQQILQHADARRMAGEGARESLYISWENIAATVYEKYAEILDRYKYIQLEKLTGIQPRNRWRSRSLPALHLSR